LLDVKVWGEKEATFLSRLDYFDFVFAYADTADFGVFDDIYAD
jgi:hypothetical protein